MSNNSHILGMYPEGQNGLDLVTWHWTKGVGQLWVHSPFVVSAGTAVPVIIGDADTPTGVTATTGALTGSVVSLFSSSGKEVKFLDTNDAGLIVGTYRLEQLYRMLLKGTGTHTFLDTDAPTMFNITASHLAASSVLPNDSETTGTSGALTTPLQCSEVYLNGDSEATTARQMIVAGRVPFISGNEALTVDSSTDSVEVYCTINSVYYINPGLGF